MALLLPPDDSGYPLAQSCWTDAGAVFTTEAAFATAGMVARLMAKNAARIR